ncbi:MAG: HAMP domain-containing protein [Firmicutes bacterium]|nr:HAMP domain-containing protein [Bacillota bacterium]
MKKTVGSIKWKLVLIYAVLVVCVILVIGIYIIGNIRQNLYRSRYQEMKYTAGRITDTMDLAYSSNEQNLAEVFSTVVTSLLTEGGNEEGLLMYLLDGEGELIYSRSGSISSVDKSSRTVLGAVAGKESEELYVHQIIENDVERSVGDYAVPVMRDGKVWYILLLRQSVTDIEENMVNNTMIIMMASLLAIGVSAFFAYFLAAGIARPIQRLTSKTKEMAKGDLEAVDEMPTISRSSDEIEELESNFGHMARELSRILSETSSEKNKLATIFDHMADGLVVYGMDGFIVQCNPAALELMGEEIEDEHFSQTFPEEHFAALLYSQEGTIAQRTLMRDDHTVRAEFAAYSNEAGASEGLIVVLQDVTEQHRAEEMQREFVANVSHELRTPITTVKSYVETILDGNIREEETLVPFLNVINKESDRMTALITELLELSRIDNRQVQLRMEVMNLTELLSDCVRRYRIHADKKQQTMEMKPDCPQVWALCDRSRIEQVLRNIIINAVIYSPEQAAITMWTTVDLKHNEGILHVKDTGMGIPHKEQKRVFERFYRIDKARSRSSGGTGLGLAIAKEMMEMHGGRIELDSTVGQGSIFHLVFPLTEREEMDEEE